MSFLYTFRNTALFQVTFGRVLVLGICSYAALEKQNKTNTEVT
jgi:hypothetical protein